MTESRWYVGMYGEVRRDMAVRNAATEDQDQPTFSTSR